MLTLQIKNLGNMGVNELPRPRTALTECSCFKILLGKFIISDMICHTAGRNQNISSSLILSSLMCSCQ